MCGCTAQVDAAWCIKSAVGGLCKEPGTAFAQAEERIARGIDRHRIRRPGGQATLGIGQRPPVLIQHDHPGVVPECVQCSGIVTQVVLALGLRMTNWAPVSDSV